MSRFEGIVRADHIQLQQRVIEFGAISRICCEVDKGIDTVARVDELLKVCDVRPDARLVTCQIGNGIHVSETQAKLVGPMLTQDAAEEPGRAGDQDSRRG